jgi:hypothetical protein
MSRNLKTRKLILSPPPLSLSVSLSLPFEIYFPYLAEDDWRDVCRSVSDLSAPWRELARHLGLDANRIDTIARENPLSMDECLSQVLIYWLRCNCNPKRNGYPSWRTLAKAVKPLNGRLFNDIKKAHPSKKNLALSPGHSQFFNVLVCTCNIEKRG